jgi:membrane-bound lytic murein transglycosylase F
MLDPRKNRNTGNRFEKKMKPLLIVCMAAFLATCGQPPSLLDEVLALGELRAITRNSPTTYYTGANGPEGPEYDLIKGFATFLGVDLKLQTADRFADLIPSVESGRAHVAAAGLTITPERQKKVNFGPSYGDVKQYVIYKLGSGRPRKIDDLYGKKLEVVAGSSALETLKFVQANRPKLIWTEDPNTDPAELLLEVANENIDYTVADSNLFQVYRNYLPEIRVGFELDIRDALAWAFPKRHDDTLIERAQQYFKFIEENGDLERITDRYYQQVQRFDYVGTRRFILDKATKLPEFRALFETTAERREMDWRLLAAIGYQESHWDPAAVSPTGVRGIMMLTRNTASVLGVDDRIDPEQSIAGGAQYFIRIKNRFPDSIRDPDRTWFALAAYNVGYGHVQDARILTKQEGKDPDLWVHVKKNLPRLTQHQWHSKTTHGYARGWEPVMYVENIRNYYDILIWMTKSGAEDVEPDEVRPTPVAEITRSSEPRS